MIRSTQAILLAGTALAAPAALAQDTIELGTIIVSGGLTPLPAERSGAAVEQLDGAEVATSDTTLTDALDRLPGVNAVHNGGLGAQTTLQLRGLPARYVGVRINGIDVADPSGVQNQFDFGGLTGAGLGRIEVLKGSQSALYGSEAVGGLVDIETWRPRADGFSGSARAEAGRYETYSGALNLGYRSERGEVALTYGRIESEGFSARAGDGERDGFDQTMLTLYGEGEVSDTLTLGGTLIYRDREVEIDNLDRFGNILPAGTNITEETGLRGFAKLGTGPVEHELSYSVFDIERRDTSPGAFTTRFTGDRHEVSYLGSAELGARATLNFGVSHTEETFTAGATRGSQDTTAFNAEWQISPSDDLDLSIALRHDEDSDFGGKLTGRVAGVWRPAEDWAVRAVAGTGFRAPSLFERFSAFGDPTLQPEESESYELGVERRFAAGKIEATVFHIEIDDLIQFDTTAVACGSGSGCYAQVPGTTTSEGLELSGDYDINAHLRIFGAYTYTRARNAGQQLALTPKHDTVLGFEADFTQKLQGSLDIRHVAGVRPGDFAPAGNKVDDYTLVGAGLTRSLHDDVEAYVRVENLFDADYETAGGFNTPGRSTFVGLRAAF